MTLSLDLQKIRCYNHTEPCHYLLVMGGCVATSTNKFCSGFEITYKATNNILKLDCMDVEKIEADAHPGDNLILGAKSNNLKRPAVTIGLQH